MCSPFFLYDFLNTCVIRLEIYESIANKSSEFMQYMMHGL